MVNALATFSKKTESKLVDPLRNVLKGRQLVYTTAPQGFGPKDLVLTNSPHLHT